MELFELVLVFLVGALSSFVGVNVGSGGLITIPALMFLGLPAKAAIATMRLGALGISAGGIYKFNKEGKIDYKIGIPAAVLAFIGAYIGANTLILIPEELIEQLIGFLILAVLVVVILNRNAGVKRLTVRGPVSRAIGYLLFLPLGFWGGFFGGGTGTFMTYVLVFIFGQTFLESAGTRKIPHLAFTLISLAILAYGGLVEWVPGVVLLAGMLTGSYAGAAFFIKKGDEWVRILFIIVVGASALKLLLFP